MKKIIFISLAVAAMSMTSCVSKKKLVECQTKGKELMGKYKTLNDDYQLAKQELAVAKARSASLQEQLASQKEQLSQQKKDYQALHSALDKSLTNASQNNISIEKLVDQINESNQYIRHLVEVKSKSDSLNLVLTNNLTR